MEYGTRVVGRTLAIPQDMLTESIPGQVYELEISTNGIPNPNQVVATLNTKIPQKFPDAKIVWAQIQGNTIRIQIQGSPFAWSLLLLFIPQILSAIGIIVAFIAVYLVIGAIPSWAWALLAVGLGLVIFAPIISKAVTPSHVPQLVEVK
jgi:hypothetical protein